MESSTALVRQLGDGYAGLLSDVRRIVRQAVVRAGGCEVDARADEFFAAFERPAAAIEASVSLQRALAKRSWPDSVEVRVRAGIHSGHPTLTDTGYIGLSVHTAARICLAASGGQILVSGETERALEGHPPAGVRLRRIGARRLPGLEQPETLFQVEADGLLNDFPRRRPR
jgi:class 3 adenylate cyclase